MSERNTSFLLEDILDAIHNKFEFIKGYSFDDYCTDIKTKYAAEHNFMITGESSARIPEELKLKHTAINWRVLKSFRSVIVHEYFGIDN